MLSGDFARKLRILNRKLRIFCKNDDSKPAGIFQVIRGEYTEICGIDKQYIPERSVLAENQTHIKGGWRRALRILIKKGLIDRPAAEKLFRTRLHYKTPRKKAQRNIVLGQKLS
jgi:hypothetical protein